MCTLPGHSLRKYIHYIISSCSCVHSLVILYINTFNTLFKAVHVYTPRSFFTYTFNTLFLAVHVYTPRSFFTYTFNTLFLAVHVYTPRSFCTLIHLIHYSWLFMCIFPGHSLHIQYIQYIIPRFLIFNLYPNIYVQAKTIIIYFMFF